MTDMFSHASTEVSLQATAELQKKKIQDLEQRNRDLVKQVSKLESEIHSLKEQRDDLQLFNETLKRRNTLLRKNRVCI